MAGKKELIIKKCDYKPMYYIQFAGGGQLPEQLKGEFTDIITAQQWVTMYYEGAFEKKYPKKEAI
jgi:hypothetical protein